MSDACRGVSDGLEADRPPHRPDTA
jgi:hypothetical protein